MGTLVYFTFKTIPGTTWNGIAGDLAWVTGQLYGIIIISVYWDFMLNMRMWWWAAVIWF